MLEYVRETHVTNRHMWNDGTVVIGCDGGYVFTVDADLTAPQLNDKVTIRFEWSEDG